MKAYRNSIRFAYLRPALVGFFPFRFHFLFLRLDERSKLRQFPQVIPRRLLPQLPAPVGIVRHLAQDTRIGA